MSGVHVLTKRLLTCLICVGEAFCTRHLYALYCLCCRELEKGADREYQVPTHLGWCRTDQVRALPLVFGDDSRRPHPVRLVKAGRVWRTEHESGFVSIGLWVAKHGLLNGVFQFIAFPHIVEHFDP